jgi:hypothetical protein
MECVKGWNTGDTQAAVQLRVTLGQFQGAYAAVKRVQPLGGTVMTPDSCALSVYDPGQDTHAIFVDGVKGKDGYIDITGYPRAAQLGWPKTAKGANVAIQKDGSVTAIKR